MPTAPTSTPKITDRFGRSRWAIAANSLTIARIIFTPVFVLLILERNPWWVTFAMGWALGWSDWADGKLARHAEPTRFGAFWDPFADKIVVVAAGFTLVSIGVFHWFPWVLITVREVGIMAYRSNWARRSLAISPFSTTPSRSAA